MNQTSSCAISTSTLHCALELSKNSWLLAIQFPDREQPSLYPIEGGNTEKLMAKLAAARDCWAKVSGSPPAITVCYEVGYDAFWLARFLMGRSIECLVIDPGSLQVNRRGRRVKTDRVDVKMLLRTLIAWCRGERHVWSLVRIPSIDEEDLRRSHRERGRLVRERTAHINRIKGLLFGQGIRGINVKSQYKTLAVDNLVTGDGHRLPPRLACEIAREIQRLAMVQEQIAKIERERDTAPTPCEATERKRHLLLQLKSIGPAISALLSERRGGHRAVDVHRKPYSEPASKTLIVEAVGNSLISFGGGTAGAAMAFVAANMMQLFYGNGSTASRWLHQLTYVLVVISVAGFIAGICFASTAVTTSL